MDQSSGSLQPRDAFTQPLDLKQITEREIIFIVNVLNFLQLNTFL